MRPDLEESFDAFVRARGDHHLRVAALLTGSSAEAEDLVQSSLVELYRAWPRLDVESGAPDAYLRKIIVNTRRTWWQTRWRQESPTASVPDRPDPAAGGGDPADRQALGSLVRSALAALPRQQRAVLVLRYLEDLPDGGGGVAARLLGRQREDARAPGAAGAAGLARRSRAVRGQRDRRAQGCEGMTKAMWEEEMDNVHELDGCDEAEGHRLLAVALETAPAGEALAGASSCGRCGGTTRRGGGCARWCLRGRSRRSAVRPRSPWR